MNQPSAEPSAGLAHMARAFALARLGLGRTSPNPAVGAVVVQAGRVVGEGYHRGPGHPHAEILALTQAGPQARGADLYVTLEPCCHWGRTPGCAQAIAAAGVRRVFWAALDPDPQVCGRGLKVLEAAGVEVHGPVLAAEAARFYAAYRKHRCQGRAWVAAKMAVSLDGKVATRTGESRWISGPQARELVHRWRDEYDAVVVGVGTVLVDDPQLTCRRSDRPGRNPLRVVVDTEARTPPQAKVVTGAGRCVIAAGEGACPARLEKLQAAGAEIWLLPRGADRRVALDALAQRLAEAGVVAALLEGGPTLLAAALAAGIVDRLLIFYAPLIIGGRAAPGMVGGEGVARLEEASRWRVERIERVGEDVLLEVGQCSLE
jgi:diaminohydroxyphosphoribosylaminopyrimidine deaminase/5-amino-6-(5-phosphoribosylamino)uracil reductase